MIKYRLSYSQFDQVSDHKHEILVWKPIHWIHLGKHLIKILSLCLGKLRFLNIVLDVAVRKKSSQTIQFLESSNSNFPETRYKILGKYF